MKRFFLTFLSMSMLYTLNAQDINKLEATIIKTPGFSALKIIETYSLHYSADIYSVSDRAVKFYQIISPNLFSFSLNIYNLDFSLYKTVTLSTPSGYRTSYLGFVTINMFNYDDKVEFIVAFTNQTETEKKDIVKLYNEDGNELFDFIDFIPYEAVKKNAEDYYILYGNVNDDYRYYSVKPSPTKVNETNIKRNALPYPNPAAQTINLPYQLKSGEQTDMQIYDVNGKLVATKRIDAAFDKIVLNVSGYEKGIYVYTYNGKSAKFVVE
jgi:hypothetical protein